jgi:hypothetical protein
MIIRIWLRTFFNAVDFVRAIETSRGCRDVGKSHQETDCGKDVRIEGEEFRSSGEHSAPRPPLTFHRGPSFFLHFLLFIVAQKLLHVEQKRLQKLNEQLKITKDVSANNETVSQPCCCNSQPVGFLASSRRQKNRRRNN